MQQKESMVERFDNAPTDVKRDIERLNRVSGLTPEHDAPFWTETTTILGSFGQWGDEQFGEVETEQTLTQDEKERLIRHTEFRLWNRLTDANMGDIADVLISHVRKELAEITELKKAA